MIDIGTIIRGISAGVAYSITAWGKKEKQKFEWSKFGTTVIIGGLAGVGMAFMDLEISGTYEFLIVAGAVPIIENLIKIAWRKIFKTKPDF